jgi:diadenosine tetraphosphate (Ap4A) HIT family hydrolase
MKNRKLLSRADYEKFLEDVPSGTCTFCKWRKYQVILKEGYRWVWIANLSPYWNYHTMLIPKRHFVELGEMSDFETLEMKELLSLVTSKYRSANLLREDKTKVEKFIYFWRKRDNTYDPVSNNFRPDHFHIHIAPDKDHLWDPVLDKNPYLCDVVGKLSF